MKILTNKETGKIRILGIYGISNYFDTKEEAIKDYKRVKRNFQARERHSFISEIVGTSYAEAKRDMAI
jgi:hypothetical protein